VPVDFEYRGVENCGTSPTTELLFNLIRYNVLRACVANINAIGLEMHVMGTKRASPFTSKDTAPKLAALPPPLHPTELQSSVAHHPYVDVFAFGKLRDTLLRFGNAVDSHDLCADLMGNGLDGKNGVIVWGEPWDPASWEVTEEFANKWHWILVHVPEVIVFTNYWRAVRGEPMLAI
jgi:hypothetical protein